MSNIGKCNQTEAKEVRKSQSASKLARASAVGGKGKQNYLKVNASPSEKTPKVNEDCLEIHDLEENIDFSMNIKQRENNDNPFKCDSKVK